MPPDDAQEMQILVRRERCTVTAQREKGTWNASGTFGGRLIEIRRAATATQAFEWWKNKAEMQQPEG